MRVTLRPRTHMRSDMFQQVLDAENIAENASDRLAEAEAEAFDTRTPAAWRELRQAEANDVQAWQAYWDTVVQYDKQGVDGSVPCLAAPQPID